GRPLSGPRHDHAPQLLEHARPRGRGFAEAGALARVARRTRRVDDHQDGVLVAVGADLADAEDVAGRLALLPERAAAPAPEMREPRLGRPGECLAGRVRDHQHVAAREVLGHDGHEPGRVIGDPRGQRQHRTATPAALSSAFASGIRISPKWKTDAASAALAWPSVKTSAMCATRPHPPEATTGTPTASATARLSAMSKPSFVPSRSMLVRRISPAP